MENLFAPQSRGVQTHSVHIPGDNHSSTGGAVSVLAEINLSAAQVHGSKTVGQAEEGFESSGFTNRGS